MSVLNLLRIRTVTVLQNFISFDFRGLSLLTCFESHLILGRHVSPLQGPYLHTGTRACVHASREVQISEPSVRLACDYAHTRVWRPFVTYFRLHTRILRSLREKKSPLMLYSDVERNFRSHTTHWHTCLFRY